MDQEWPRRFELALPAWLDEHFVATARGGSAEQRMDFAIALARRNLAEGTGGPFGAAVFEISDGRLLACGVNVVEASGASVAHAEILALTLAQRATAQWNLAAEGARRVLVSSAAPCAMCLGALPWSGIAALECGAATDDVEAIGFDEGDKPANWEARLRARGVEVRSDIRRAEATAVLRDYARRGGSLYQPRSGA